MKKYVLVTFLMAVVLLFSQCRKPVFPNFNEGENQEVTFTTGGGDEKGDLKPSGATLLKYEWASTDKLYVYGIKNDGITGVGFAGILDEITLYDGNHKAKFHGYVTIPAGSEKLRFVHYGSGVSVDSEGLAISDFTFQDGNLWGTEKSISSRIVSYIDMEINDENVYDCKEKMGICYAIIKLNLSGFNGNVNVSGIESKGVRINTKGEIDNIAGIFSILEGVSSSSDEYYVALAPKATQTSIVFTNDKLIGELKVGKINSNVYYADTGGEAYTIEAKEMGVLSGLFTVNSSGKRVRFSKSNLKYNGSSWTFTASQSDYPTVYDANWVGHFFWCTDKNYAFRENYEVTTTSTSDIIFTNYTLDTPNPNFTVNGVTGKFRCLSIGSSSEFDYLINTRRVKDQAGNQVVSYGHGTVYERRGFFILPDNWDGSVCNNFQYGARVEGKNVFSSSSTPTWAQMESAGVVFLPAAGYGRDDGSGYVPHQGEFGNYWMSSNVTSSPYEGVEPKDLAYGLFYNLDATNPMFPEHKSTAYAIRLVVDVTPDGTGSAEGFDSGSW